jgi:serine/threonine-protein kinase HipA
MPPRVGALDIWMNGFYVGRWERAGVSGGADRLTYNPAWMAAREGRPLSLSLPFSRAHGDRPVALRSQAVAAQRLATEPNRRA